MGKFIRVSLPSSLMPHGVHNSFIPSAVHMVEAAS